MRSTVAGGPSASLGLRGLTSSILGGSYDPDAAAFFAAVVANGGTTSSGEKSAVNTLVLGLKAASLWTAFTSGFLYPFVGGSAQSCAINLAAPSAFKITWSGGMAFGSGGVTGDGTSGYGDTGLNPSTSLSATNNSLGTYQTNSLTNGAFSASSFDGTNLLGIAPNSSGTATYYDAFSGGNVTGSVTDSLGLFTVSRTSSNAVAGYRDSVSVGTNTGTATMPNSTIKLLRFDTVGFYSAYTLACAFAGASLTGGQIPSFYTLIQAFQTSLGRQV